MRKGLFSLVIAAVVLVLPSISYEGALPSHKCYTIGANPLNLPIEQLKRYAPLAKYLRKRLDTHFKVKIFGSFPELKEMLEDRSLDIVFITSVVYLYLEKYLTPLVLSVDKNNSPYIKGLIIVRADSPIKTIKDLKGKTILTPSTYTPGGYWSQKIYLEKHGINPDKDLKIKRVEYYLRERVPLNIYNKKADAGFVKKIALKMAYEKFNIPKGSFRVLAETAPVPNWVFCANKMTVPAFMQKRISEALVKLGRTHKAIKNFREVYQMDHFIYFNPEYLKELRVHMKKK